MAYMSLKAERIIQDYQIKICAQARKMWMQEKFDEAWEIEKEILPYGYTKERYIERVKKFRDNAIAQEKLNEEFNFICSQMG